MGLRGESAQAFWVMSGLVVAISVRGDREGSVVTCVNLCNDWWDSNLEVGLRAKLANEYTEHDVTGPGRAVGFGLSGPMDGGYRY